MNKDVISGTEIPMYTLRNLKRFNNTLIHRKHVVKYGETGLFDIFKSQGYCVKLVISKDSISTKKYPTDANYILELI